MPEWISINSASREALKRLGSKELAQQDFQHPLALT
jgi:hypothetical protein